MDSEKEEMYELMVSVLRTSSEPLSLHQLNREYFALEDKHLDFKKFGFTSLFHFVKSNPLVNIENRNGNILVRPAASTAGDGDAHIADLVKGQKQSSKSVFRYNRYYPQQTCSKYNSTKYNGQADKKVYGNGRGNVTNQHFNSRIKQTFTCNNHYPQQTYSKYSLTNYNDPAGKQVYGNGEDTNYLFSNNVIDQNLNSVVKDTSTYDRHRPQQNDPKYNFTNDNGHVDKEAYRKGEDANSLSSMNTSTYDDNHPKQTHLKYSMTSDSRHVDKEDYRNGKDSNSLSSINVTDQHLNPDRKQDRYINSHQNVYNYVEKSMKNKYSEDGCHNSKSVISNGYRDQPLMNVRLNVRGRKSSRGRQTMSQSHLLYDSSYTSSKLMVTISRGVENNARKVTIPDRCTKFSKRKNNDSFSQNGSSSAERILKLFDNDEDDCSYFGNESEISNISKYLENKLYVSKNENSCDKSMINCEENDLRGTYSASRYQRLRNFSDSGYGNHADKSLISSKENLPIDSLNSNNNQPKASTNTLQYEGSALKEITSDIFNKLCADLFKEVVTCEDIKRELSANHIDRDEPDDIFDYDNVVLSDEVDDQNRIITQVCDTQVMLDEGTKICEKLLAQAVKESQVCANLMHLMEPNILNKLTINSRASVQSSDSNVSNKSSINSRSSIQSSKTCTSNNSTINSRASVQSSDSNVSNRTSINSRSSVQSSKTCTSNNSTINSRASVQSSDSNVSNMSSINSRSSVQSSKTSTSNKSTINSRASVQSSDSNVSDKSSINSRSSVQSSKTSTSNKSTINSRASVQSSDSNVSNKSSINSRSSVQSSKTSTSNKSTINSRASVQSSDSNVSNKSSINSRSSIQSSKTSTSNKSIINSTTSVQSRDETVLNKLSNKTNISNKSTINSRAPVQLSDANILNKSSINSRSPLQSTDTDITNGSLLVDYNLSLRDVPPGFSEWKLNLDNCQLDTQIANLLDANYLSSNRLNDVHTLNESNINLTQFSNDRNYNLSFEDVPPGFNRPRMTSINDQAEQRVSYLQNSLVAPEIIRLLNYSSSERLAFSTDVSRSSTYPADCSDSTLDLPPGFELMWTNQRK